MENLMEIKQSNVDNGKKTIYQLVQGWSATQKGSSYYPNSTISSQRG